MPNLEDLIKLAKVDGGKFFVMDEKGEAKLVILSIEDYEKLLIGKLQKQIVDVENINKIITQAQLNENDPQNFKGLSRTDPDLSGSGTGAQLREPEIIVPEIQTPQKRTVMPRVDLREEVIDPSFDFEGPKMEVDDL